MQGWFSTEEIGISRFSYLDSADSFRISPIIFAILNQLELDHQVDPPSFQTIGYVIFILKENGHFDEIAECSQSIPE